jgi:hypothetical protein
MSHIIKELSSNGFKTSVGWFTCDKFKVLDKAIFKGLKVGDSVDNIKTNKGGFVIAFDIPVANRGGEPVSEAKTATPHLNSVPPIQVSRNGLIYGQCVNLAFNSFEKGIDLTFKEGVFIKKGFNLADDIYNEYITRIK